MSSKFSVKVVGGDKIKDFLKKYEDNVGDGVLVGVGFNKDSLPYPDGTSVHMVATQNEFGSKSKRIPERSFLRSNHTKTGTNIKTSSRKVSRKHCPIKVRYW